jgi:(p)ppGpp synthase/HD superfamily hydrolase
MRLFLIYEGPNSSLRPLYGKKKLKQFRNVLSFMPQHKVDHSLRVGATAAKSGLNQEEVLVAILHDYIERGGELSELNNLGVSPRTIKIMKMLSIGEKTPGADDTTEVQHHIEEMLNDNSIDEHDKNVAIIVKCADRIDNLKKRIKKRKLSNGYAAASTKLLNTLLASYTGDPELLLHIKNKINKLGIELLA